LAEAQDDNIANEMGYAKLSLARRPLHKVEVSQYCHPEPFGKLRTGSAKDLGFFLRSVTAFDKSRFFSSRRNTPLLQNDNVRGFC
jgi:hypothetical protein